jgi:hypothetical protein
MRTLVVALSLALAAATPALAGPADVVLFGKEPGNDEALACFIRHYDAAHLKAHPQQNVTDMLLLVNKPKAEGADDRWYTLSLGVHFRDVKNQFHVEGGCSALDNGTQLLGCGIDCDGGAIDVRPRDANSVLVDIPYGARHWDPTNDEENPAAAEFGQDDKVFRLDRTALKECLSLVFDEDLKARIADAE